jgi:hypothetical protein
MGHIDDPDFDPTKAEQPLKRNELAEMRRDEIVHLARFGYSPEHIRMRLDGEVSLSHIREVIRTIHAGPRDRSTKAAA